MGIPRLYIDTSVLIDAIKAKFAGLPISEDIEFTYLLLNAAKNGDIEIFTSLLTVAECRRDENLKPPKENVKQYIRELLLSETVIQIIEVTQSIVESARDLDWQHGIFFGGADAVHVATAIKMQCKELLATDEPMLKRSDKLLQANLGVKLIKPSATNFLPNKYKQKTLFDDLKAIKAKQARSIALIEKTKESKNDITQRNGQEEKSSKSKLTYNRKGRGAKLPAISKDATNITESGDSGAAINASLD